MVLAAAAPKQDGELTILSIDGGGIRGLIPAKVLEYLESELQVRTTYLINSRHNYASAASMSN